MQCYGPEAAAYTASRLFGRVVQLEDDVERRDIYGRRVAYVNLDGANFERAPPHGYARLLVIEPNHADALDRIDDEPNARAHGVGLRRVRRCAMTSSRDDERSCHVVAADDPSRR